MYIEKEDKREGVQREREGERGGGKRESGREREREEG